MQPSFYDYVSLNDLYEKIQNFKELDFKSLTVDEIREQLRATLMVQIGNNQKSIIPMYFTNLEQSNFFYRVRKLNKLSPKLPLDDMCKKADVWGPEEARITEGGRINGINQSVFYTSLHLSLIHI